MKDALRFIFFRGLYSTLDLFTEELEQICNARGYEFCTVHAIDKKGTILPSEREKLHLFLREKVTAAIGFGNMGLLFLDENNKSYWDTYQIPYINMMMDHPMHFAQMFDYASKHTILLCPDHNHVNYVKRFYPNIRMVEFLPHAGKESKVGKIPMKDRKIDVLYAGGLSRGVVGSDVPNLNKFSDFDGEILFHKVIDRLVKDPGKTTEEAIETSLEELGIFYEKEKLCETIHEFRFIDTYITSLFREMTIRYLVENNVKVTLYGAGWDVCEWIDNENLNYKGVVPAKMIPVLMQESKIVLNTMTWFKDGSHDRIFNGMLAKAAVISDTSNYLCNTLTDNQDICFFHLKQLKELPTLVKGLLNDEAKLEMLSENGYQTAKAHHTWEARFDTILQEILPKFRE